MHSEGHGSEYSENNRIGKNHPFPKGGRGYYSYMHSTVLKSIFSS